MNDRRFGQNRVMSTFAECEIKLCIRNLKNIFLSLAFIILSSVCANSQADDNLKLKTGILFSNSAVNYPIFGGIFSKGERNVALFVNLENGDRREVEAEQGSFSSIGASLKDQNVFLLSETTGEISNVYMYIYDTKTLSLIMSGIKTFLHPFLSGSGVCALVPELKTKKGLYNFLPYCSGGELKSAAKIVTASDYAIGRNEVSFIVDYDGMRVYTIKTEKRPDVSYINIGEYFTPLLFYVGDDLYYIRRCIGCSNLFKRVGKNFLEVTKEIPFFVQKTIDLNCDRLIYVDKSRVVCTDVDYDTSVVNILNTSVDGSTTTKRFRIEIK